MRSHHSLGIILAAGLCFCAPVTETPQNAPLHGIARGRRRRIVRRRGTRSRRRSRSPATTKLSAEIPDTRESMAQGHVNPIGVHRDPTLEPLRGYTPFDELIKPKG